MAPSMLLRVLALVALGLSAANGQMFGGGGRNNKMSQEELSHMQGDYKGEAAVDRAMKEWDTLASNPEMMTEMLDSFKDPEVQAKAQEMLKDPEYMRAAKKKLESMQAKARQAGYLDANNNPVSGAATSAAQGNPAAASMMAAMMSARGGTAGGAAAAGGAGAAGGDMAAQIAAMQRENTAMKQSMGYA